MPSSRKDTVESPGVIHLAVFDLRLVSQDLAVAGGHRDVAVQRPEKESDPKIATGAQHGLLGGVNLRKVDAAVSAGDG